MSGSSIDLGVISASVRLGVAQLQEDSKAALGILADVQARVDEVSAQVKETLSGAFAGLDSPTKAALGGVEADATSAADAIAEMGVAGKAAGEEAAAGGEQAAAGLREAGLAAQEGGGGIQGLMGNLLGFGGAIAGVQLAATAFGFLRDKVTDAVQAGMQGNQAMALLAQGLKTTHDASGQTLQSLDALSTSIMRNTGIDDDAVKSAQQMLLTFTGLGKEVFPQATQAVADMATRLNGGAIPSAQQMNSVALQLGKALNDPAKGLTMLTREGVTFTDQQQKQIKAMVAAGDTAGAQKLMLAELAKEFGGSAAAAGHANGGLAILRAEMANTTQTIGQALIPIMNQVTAALARVAAAVAPVIENLARGLPGAVATVETKIDGFDGVINAVKATIAGGTAAVKDAVNFWNQWQTPIEVLAGLITTALLPALIQTGVQATITGAQMLAGLVTSAATATAGFVTMATTAIVDAVTGLITYTAAGWAAAAATIAATWPILAIIAAVALLAAGIYELVTHWKQVSEFLSGVWNAVVQGVGAGFSWLGTQAHALWNNVVATFNVGVSFVRIIVQDWVNFIVGLFKWLYDHNTYFADLVNSIREQFQLAQRIVTTIWNDITGFITAVWNGYVTLARTVWGAVFGAIQDVWDRVVATITAELNLAKAIITVSWNAIVGIISAVGNTIKSDVAAIWNTVVSFISGIAGRISSAVKTGVVDPITNEVKGLINLAQSWGQNLIKLFIQGIEDEAGALKNAVTQMASNVAKVLGFHSPAEEGPGSDADTWAPNLMKMFTGGITAATPSLAYAATQAMAAVKSALASGVVASVSGANLSLPNLPSGLSSGSGGLSGGVLSAVVAASVGAGAGAASLSTGQPTGQASNGVYIEHLEVSVVASSNDGEPYQAGVAFGNGFAAAFQQARTQRGF